jgi:hypothetical protein
MPFVSKIMATGVGPNTAAQQAGTAATGLVAVGTNQATALQLSDTFNAITTSNASTGLLLPKCEQGALVFIYNLSGQTLTIYSFETSGVTMNSAVAGSTGVSLSNTKTGIAFADKYNHWVVTCCLTST